MFFFSLAHSERLHDGPCAPNEHESPQHQRQRRYPYQWVDHQDEAEQDAKHGQDAHPPPSSLPMGPVRFTEYAQSEYEGTRSSGSFTGRGDCPWWCSTLAIFWERETLSQTAGS